MEIRVLGPLSAELHGLSVLPTAGKPRQILALLALYSNQPVPVGALMEEIWGSRPPRSALTTLQTYILQLRRQMSRAMVLRSPADAKGLLVTRPGSYLLHLPKGSVDTEEFERLSALGQRAHEAHEYEQAVRWFRAAQGLWRGPALVDVRVGCRLEIETSRLEESRTVLLERRIDAELRLGRHYELLTELTALTRRLPLHEGVHAQAMLAYYRAGRPAVALEMFRLLRSNMVEDLGIEPSPRLQRLQRAVLSGDPDLDVTSGTDQVLLRLGS